MPSAYTHQSSQSPRATKPMVDTSCQLYFAPRNRNRCQPLYRPAALRRNDSSSSTSVGVLLPASPPVSPHVSHAELSTSAASSLSSSSQINKSISPSSWLGVLPWGPTFDTKSTESNAAGVALPRSAWRPDEQALICAATDCKLRFDLINRRHHCRKCGEVFCSAHSSRTVPLWPSPANQGEHDVSTPPTPKATPKSTPRSSHVDLSSLVPSAHSSAFSIAGSSSSASGGSTSSTPTSSPPNLRHFLGMPLACRVCDSCYFNAPAPTPSALLTPPLTTPIRSPFASPKGSMIMGHSPSSYGPEGASSTAPPQSRAKSRSRSRHNSSSGGSRSRQGSASGSSSTPSSSFASTPATSLENSFSALSTNGPNLKRGVSPATSLRAQLASITTTTGSSSGVLRQHEEEADSSDDETTEEEDPSHHEFKDGMLVASETSFGIGFQSTWSTF